MDYDDSVPDKGYRIQRLLLGTHTNDEDPNYLQIASVRSPENLDVKKYEESIKGNIGYSY